MSEASRGADNAVAERGWMKRLGKGIVSLTTFSVNTSLAAAAVIVGVTTIQMRAEEKPAIEAAPLVVVKTIRPDFQKGYDVQRSFVGRLEPARQTNLAFELSGTVREIRVDEGDAVSKGDVVAVLDTRALEAERRRLIANRKAAESDRELADLTFRRRQKLKDNGHVSEQVLDQARLAFSRLDATIAQIDASLEAVDINLDKSVLRAPFDGRVGARLLDDGATLSPGAPVLMFLELARPTVRIGLSPEVVDRLKGDDVFDIRISNRIYDAKLIGLRPDLQTRTRTIETLFELEVADKAPSFGRLAELSLTERVETEGFWVPTDALKEGPRGLWTVLVAAPETSEDPAGSSVIAREAVEVLYADADRAFVRGTITKETKIISEGVHRVVVGQSVAVAEGRV